LAVTTTPSSIATGINGASSRAGQWVALRTMAVATRRFQPKCMLGIAAYWLTSDGGWKM
jgi:hypothetical protein